MRSVRLPLTTLLSQVLVAFTIECDNEFERQVPHRITEDDAAEGSSARGAPWLVSLPVWINFLSLIPEPGFTIRELYLRSGVEKLALKQRLRRLARWGYLAIDRPPGDAKASPPGDWIVRPRPGAKKAWQVWPSLPAAIEDRWRQRYGREAADRLRASLTAIVQQLDRALPEALPILNAVWAGWFAELPNPPRLQRQPIAAAVPGLHALLSKTLFALTLDFERQSDLSLAIGSNLIRVLNDTGVRHADLPRLTGVSKEAIKMMLGFLCKYRFVVVENDPAAPRAKQVRLTAKGIESRHTFEQRLKAAETRWQKTYGAETLQNLRQSLETLTIAPAGQPSPLLASVQSYPEGWRARRPQPETLPHHPLILHRGAFPDGA